MEIGEPRQDSGFEVTVVGEVRRKVDPAESPPLPAVAMIDLTFTRVLAAPASLTTPAA